MAEHLRTAQIALHGGTPVRSTILPYGRHEIGEDDIAAVAAVLRSDWLTSGPLVGDFERAFAATVGARHAVAVSSGTAALHAAMFALGVGPGDEVIVPPLTFAASANAVLYQGATPVFADVLPDTLLIDPAKVEAAVTPRTRAVVAVDYAGQPCDYAALRRVTERAGIALVADACHALGAREGEVPVGAIADLTAFSLHPVKHVTTGEGGAITTADETFAQRMRMFRNHGISVDHRERSRLGSWFYEIAELGYNYRLTDVQCGLGLSQLPKLTERIARRQAIASAYRTAFAGVPGVQPLGLRRGVSHAYHLFVVRIDFSRLSCVRSTFFAAMRAEGIGVNVHYIPVHLHPLYRERLGTGPGMFPVSEAAYEEILSLPIFPGMSDRDLDDVVEATAKLVEAFAR